MYDFNRYKLYIALSLFENAKVSSKGFKYLQVLNL
jgi:hypothetical protein